MNYKMIRILSLGVVGFFPILLSALVFILLNSILAAGSIFLLVVIGTIIISQILLASPFFVQVMDGNGILLLNLNSSGLIPVGLAKIKFNKFGQRLFSFKINNVDNTKLYNRDSIWHLKPAMDGTYEILRNEKGNKIYKIELDEAAYYDSNYRIEAIPCIIWNSQQGKFLSKSELGDQETSNLLKMISLNEQKELRELKESIDNFLRDYADKLNNLTSSLSENPLFKVIIIIVILLIIGGVIVMFFPQIQTMIFGGVETISTPTIITPAK